MAVVEQMAGRSEAGQSEVLDAGRRRARVPTGVKVALIVVGALVVLAVGGLLGLDYLVNHGVWAGEGQLDALGVPVHHVVYEGEQNDKGTDLCFSANCVTVTRTYALGGGQRMYQVEAAVRRRLRAIGYRVGDLGCAVDGITYLAPAHWEFSCSFAGTQGSKGIDAIMYLAGVDPAIDNLPPLTYDPYGGGGPSHDVPVVPGDPVVRRLQLNASG